MKAVRRARTRAPRRQLWLFETPLPQPFVPASAACPSSGGGGDTSVSELFPRKVQDLNSSCPHPFGILYFKYWTLSCSSLELSVFSVCWLRCVGGILWGRGSNILNRHCYFQNNHFHAPLATEAGMSFASIGLV